MSQDELLPEELNHCQQVLGALVPRASRVDRDRLMLRLGQQSARRGSTPWKWATGASLLLAAVLGLRPAFVPQAAAPTQLAAQDNAKTLEAAPREKSLPADHAAAPRPEFRPSDDQTEWLLALANGRFDRSRTLTVRPPWRTSEPASPASDAAVSDNSSNTDSTRSAQPLRWGDRRLRRDNIDLAAPPTS